MAPAIADVRVGLNGVAAETSEAARDYAAMSTVPWWGYRPEPAETPVWKYPLLREMLYGPLAFAASHVGWFDDDSYFDCEAAAHDEETWVSWWQAFLARLAGNLDYAGYRYRIASRPEQLTGFRRQPWWNDTAVRRVMAGNRDPRIFMLFATGGLWFARYAKLAQWGYPFPQLLHNGGDSLLGLVAQCQNWTTLWLPKGGHPGEHFMVCNNAKRRGGATPWPWQADTDERDRRHYDFTYTLEPLNDAARAIGPHSTHRAGRGLPC